MSASLPPVIQALLWTHVLAGFVAFFIALVPLLTAKGGATHRRWGKVYFGAMAVMASSALFVALWRPIVFLAFIAVFSFYFAFRGYRVLFRKKPREGQKPGAIDWCAAAIAFVGGVALIVGGTVQPGPAWVRLGMVPIVFGILGVVIAAKDMWEFKHPSTNPKFWWYAHMGGMIGSYIAAVSAFSVVNLVFLPTTVRWLWPSVIGVPAILVWIRHYRRKFEPTKPPAAATP
jgi:uncharacterized membrane protein